MTHYACVEFIPFEADHLEQMGVEIPDWQTAVLDRCRGWTLMVDGEPLLSAGICLMWPGMAEAWQFTAPGPGWRRYLKSVVREMRRRIPQLWEEAGLRRLQASCLNDPSHWAWLQYHGFALEGCMKSYSLEGEDYVLAAIVRAQDNQADNQRNL